MPSQVSRVGISILLVEADIATTFEPTSRGFVLESGRLTPHGATAELARNATVREAHMVLA